VYTLDDYLDLYLGFGYKEGANNFIDKSPGESSPTYTEVKYANHPLTNGDIDYLREAFGLTAKSPYDCDKAGTAYLRICYYPDEMSADVKKDILRSGLDIMVKRKCEWRYGVEACLRRVYQ